MWFAGIFKGVIAFTLTLRYETRILQLRPLHKNYSDIAAYQKDVIKWLSLYGDMKSVLNVIYGLVIFTNVFWGGLLPFIIDLLKKYIKSENQEDYDHYHGEKNDDQLGIEL